LVVIAIITILAAILFPVFARARENARRASCQSNLKQIALGIFMYNQDYDEMLPGADYVNGWADAMQPYLKSTQIFQCPSETNAGSSNPAATGNPGYTDYWYNLSTSGKSDASFAAPSLTDLLGDGSSSSASYWIWPGGGTGTCTPWTAAAPKADLGSSGAHRHLTGANLAFADGHVKWEKGVSDSSTSLSGVYTSCTGTAHGMPTFSPQDADVGS
jgi:prepilin-type processing-associated H-X9-DG protein